MSLLLTGSGQLLAEGKKPIWNLDQLGNPPKWDILQSPLSSSSHVKAIFFNGLPFQGRPTRVFAWLGIPEVKPGEKVPGMVLVHGGGGTAFEEWVRLWVSRGYAAIAVDTCGQVPVGTYSHWVHDEQGGPQGWGGWHQIDQPLEDQWTYQAVADIVLAHSLLQSLSEVDSNRTGITGISWGGYLTCIIAGVDQRFKFAAPVYGCGFYMDTVFTNELYKLDLKQRDRWMKNWDASVYLPEASMPMLWVAGAKDHFYPLPALQKSYRLPPGARTLAVRVGMMHGQAAGEAPEEIHAFADNILKGGNPLPKITGQGRDGTHVWITYASKVGAVKAELNYTKDRGNWEKRTWGLIPATMTENKATAELPNGTQAYYINLFDDHGCVVSTEHEECDTR